MSNILILYSTTDGHTIEICRRIASVLTSGGASVEMQDLKDVPVIREGDFDKIVIGASIRYGKHQPRVAAFINQNQALLEAHPNAFFTVNVVARKPEKNTPETNPYLIKFLRTIDWRPQLLGVFAGKINYPIYRFWDRQMIRLIMWMTKGPTDPTTVIEFTDWDKVEDFARQVAAL
jgi:menaquinone-dependent protoporphyrinogen oxidase